MEIPTGKQLGKNACRPHHEDDLKRIAHLISAADSVKVK
jgi:hypothetical protein